MRTGRALATLGAKRAAVRRDRDFWLADAHMQVAVRLPRWGRSVFAVRRDRDFGSLTSPYVLGDERAPGPHARTDKWLDMVAGVQRKIVPIRLARPCSQPLLAHLPPGGVISYADAALCTLMRLLPCRFGSHLAAPQALLQTSCNV